MTRLPLAHIVIGSLQYHSMMITTIIDLHEDFIHLLIYFLLISIIEVLLHFVNIDYFRDLNDIKSRLVENFPQRGSIITTFVAVNAFLSLIILLISLIIFIII